MPTDHKHLEEDKTVSVTCGKADAKPQAATSVAIPI
jgi:hypothetical protein